MGPVNYMWYQYRFLALAQRMVERDGGAALGRFWSHFAQRAPTAGAHPPARGLARELSTGVSPALGRAARDWR